MNGGGTLLGLGSASETAQQLLNLPIQRVATTQPFSIGGSLLRETFDPTVPAAWGLPAEGSTYFNGDRAWNVSDPTAQIAGAYPGTGSMLASGYEVGAEQLRGKADIVSMKVGQGSVTVTGSQTTFRSWPRVAVADRRQLGLPRAVDRGHRGRAEGAGRGRRRRGERGAAAAR